MEALTKERGSENFPEARLTCPKEEVALICGGGRAQSRSRVAFICKILAPPERTPAHTAHPKDVGVGPGRSGFKSFTGHPSADVAAGTPLL